MMERFLRHVLAANMVVWLAVLFAGHASLYLALGTARWLSAALWATAFYGVVLAALRLYARERVR